MTAWRNFAIQKLIGNDGYDIEDNSPNDWPEANGWQMVLEEFKTCQKKLLQLLKDVGKEKWNNRVAGRNYTFGFCYTELLSMTTTIMGKLDLCWLMFKQLW